MARKSSEAITAVSERHSIVPGGLVVALPELCKMVCSETGSPRRALVDPNDPCGYNEAAVSAVVGFEYRSRTQIKGWPLIHVCLGMDARTMRPKIARGIIAVGNISVGVFAVGGVALGLFTVGGVSAGLLGALGGLAVGLGFSLGGLAIGSVAVGGLALGLVHAIGGAAFGPSVISGARCDETAIRFVKHLLGGAFLPPGCR